MRPHEAEPTGAVNDSLAKDRGLTLGFPAPSSGDEHRFG
jgi:hypothetical protein